MITKYYADACGVNMDVLIKCIEKAFELADSDNEIKRVVLYSYTKNNFTQLSKIFGVDNIKNMFNAPIKFNKCSKPIGCATEITYKKECEYINQPRDVVVCCYMDSEAVFQVDDYMTAKYIIAMSWTSDGLNAWKKRWNALDVFAEQDDNIVKSNVEEILTIAIAEMDDRMYNTKSLSHTTDAEICKTYIRTIHKYLPNVTPSEIEDYLVSELGWQNKNASEVGNLLQRLKEGRTFQGGQKTHLKDIYNNWKNPKS